MDTERQLELIAHVEAMAKAAPAGAIVTMTREAWKAIVPFVPVSDSMKNDLCSFERQWVLDSVDAARFRLLKRVTKKLMTAPK